jgi:transglutaminase-like putative cysteine protease
MSTLWSGPVRLTAWAWLAALLAGAALAPLVADKQYLVVGAFAGLLVAATGVGCRLAHLPTPVTVLLQLLVLVEWLTIGYAGSDAWAGVVPNGASTATLADLVRSALETARTSVPPAPVDTAVVACMGTIVALVVLVVDLVAVTWRRPALVGLLFLGIYMAPVSLLAGNVPVTAFVPGAIGYVFLLAAEQRDRLSHWGRQITSAGSLLVGREPATPTVTSLVSAGRRVGFSAVALAVVLPVLVPTLPRTLFGDGPLSVDGSVRGAGGGDGSVEVDNPMLDLTRNLQGQSTEELLRVTTDDPDPSYLRLAALDAFTGDSWKPGPRTSDTSIGLDQTPVVPGLSSQVARQRFEYDVEFTTAFQSSWLPTSYPVSKVTADGEWGIDTVHLDVSARDEDLETAGMGYGFTAAEVTPTREQLEGGGELPEAVKPFLDLPGLPSDISALAEDVTADADLPIDKALALQQWFREDSGIKYSTQQADGDGIEAIEDFLFASKVGYCEQFAAAMAIMARSVSIPARVGVGFLRPTEVAPDKYVYVGKDMHSWPELYFDGVGWLRFEPTPGTRAVSAPSYNSTAGGGPETTAPTATATGGPSAAAPTRAAEGDVPGQSGGGGGGGNTSTVLWTGLVLLGLVALALTPRLVRSEVRRRRWARAAATGAAEPAWLELRDGTVDLGLAFDDRATVRTAGQGLRRHLGNDQQTIDALNRLVVRVEQARFARSGGGTGAANDEPGHARGDVETVLAALAAGRNRRRLLRATWLPQSLLRRAGRDAGGGLRSGRGVLSGDGAVVRVEGTATR